MATFNKSYISSLNINVIVTHLGDNIPRYSKEYYTGNLVLIFQLNTSMNLLYIIININKQIKTYWIIVYVSPYPFYTETNFNTLTFYFDNSFKS